MEGEEGSHSIPPTDHWNVSKHILDLLEGRDKWFQRTEAHCFKSCKSASSLGHVLTEPFASAHIFDRSSTAYQSHPGGNGTSRPAAVSRKKIPIVVTKLS